MPFLLLGFDLAVYLHPLIHPLISVELANVLRLYVRGSDRLL